MAEGDEESRYSFSKFVCNSEESLKRTGLKKVITSIHTCYAELDPNLKELLKTFQVEEHLDIIKKFDSCDITVYCFGGKIKATETVETTITMINKSELKDTLEKSDAGLVVCIVELVFEGKRMTVKKESLDIMRHCLLSRPYDTEVLINSYYGFHATEAKYIVFETLYEMEINTPKAIHHAAETQLEDIVLYRVKSAIQHVWQVAESLRSSFPELKDIEVMTDYAFQENLNKENVSQLANSVILTDGDKEIGQVSSGKMIYYNGLKVRQIKAQLIEKCSKTIVHQIGSTVTEKLLRHILNNLETAEFKKHLPTSLDDAGFKRYIFERFAAGFGVGITVFLTLILGPIISIISAPFMLYVLFHPVDVNDPEWRVSCVRDIIAKFEKKRKQIISDTTSSVQKHFELMSKELKSLMEEINFPFVSGYNEAMFKEHRRLKGICSSELLNENLRQNVKKIIIGKNNGTLQANMYVKKDAELMVEIDKLINLHKIGDNTDEDKQVQRFIIENKPRIDPKIRDAIKQVISNEKQRLFMLHSNLSIIGPSPVKSSDNGKTVEVCPCIVFYCIGKGFIPVGEPLFPKTLNGIGIDVREGLCTPF